MIRQTIIDAIRVVVNTLEQNEAQEWVLDCKNFFKEYEGVMIFSNYSAARQFIVNQLVKEMK